MGGVIRYGLSRWAWVQGVGQNDWLEGIGDKQFLEKLFEFESDGIFRFGGWRENCIVDREMWGFR